MVANGANAVVPKGVLHNNNQNGTATVAGKKTKIKKGGA